MATATLITIPVYQINSNFAVDRNLYPFGMPVIFAGASLNVQPNVGSSLKELQVQFGSSAIPPTNTALLYSRVRSTATGDTLFFSNLTPSAIATLANA